MSPQFDLIGVGIGPFNLSVAALASKLPELKTCFLDQKASFQWHSEIMFRDSFMQTSYIKDLVTPVDPTNPHSFINFLVQKGLFYAHLNTGRSTVSRREFELYCQWVCENMGEQLNFNTAVESIDFDGTQFRLQTSRGEKLAKNISVATGHAPWLPDFATPFVSPTCFHAKSAQLSGVNLTGKRVVVVGGGQTGLEVFRNAFQGHIGAPAAVTLLSRRHTLEPLDESPFTNEYFTPEYVRNFHGIPQELKAPIVKHQRLASDGNTPFYLQELYNELYQLKHVEGDQRPLNILPQRQVEAMTNDDGAYQLNIYNCFNGSSEIHHADVVILCTGFKSRFPACLDKLRSKFNLDAEGRPQLTANFAVDWEHGASHKIYLLNHGRHSHGIAEPQTSLMAWRGATILNDLLDRNAFKTVDAVANFTQHGTLA